MTGSASADKAILAIYDIFGFYPQTIQGADLLAHHGYHVFMPDFFAGKAAQLAWYPPDDEEQKAQLEHWWLSAAPDRHLPKIDRLLDAAESLNPAINTWGVLGYCWGGKMASLLAGTDCTRFKAAVQTSPARMDPAEAEKVTIPMMLLASEEESEELVGEYTAGLRGTSRVEHFKGQVHGFMSARADLGDPGVRKAYHEGYRLALEFFNENLG
jgi:dienelactone hydrolase